MTSLSKKDIEKAQKEFKKAQKEEEAEATQGVGTEALQVLVLLESKMRNTEWQRAVLSTLTFDKSKFNRLAKKLKEHDLATKDDAGLYFRTEQGDVLAKQFQAHNQDDSNDAEFTPEVEVAPDNSEQSEPEGDTET